MYRSYVTRAVTIALGFICSFAAQSRAVTIRADVDDSLYIGLGENPNYASAGLLNAGTTCAVAGGVLIHPEWVLTAAHCTPTSSNQTVLFSFGSTSTDLDLTVEADNWFRHSQYDGNVAAGKDFGLVHLSEPILSVTPSRLYRGVGEIGRTATVVGYGRTGTGLTGDTEPRGTRRGGEFLIDVFGGAIGLSGNIALGDFDNPNNPNDSIWGPTTPLPLESNVALNDSGSPWFIEVNGLTYAAAISSFIYDTDGDPNADYGDASGGMRISREITWIDDNHDRTLFWDGTVGNWSDDAKWVAGLKPTAANAAVIDLGQADISTGAQARYVFVEGTGKLEVGNTLVVNDILVSGQGTLSPLGNIGLATTVNMSAGALEFGLGTVDQFTITGNVKVAGQLLVKPQGYDDPTTRGDADVFTLLVASDLSGAFDSQDYDGTAIDLGTNYVGESSNGADGMFRILTVDQGNSDEIVLTNYFALPGDANGDLLVDGLDFIIWNEHKFTSGTDWSTGDFNGDSLTDGLDFILWNQFKFTSANITMRTGDAPVLVPEPIAATLMLLGVAGLSVFRRRNEPGFLTGRRAQPGPRLNALAERERDHQRGAGGLPVKRSSQSAIFRGATDLLTELCAS